MRRVILGVCLTLLCAAPSFSATISIRPVLVAVLDEDFTPVDPSLVVEHDPLRGATLAPRDGHYVLWVDVIMNISDLQPDQLCFANAEFDISLSGLSQDVLLAGWVPDLTPGKWSDNLDAGPSGTDLERVLISGQAIPPNTLGVAPFENDPGHSVLPGELVGSVFLDLPGDASLAAEISVIPTTGSVWKGPVGRESEGVPISGGRLTLPIPEPPSAALLIGCAVGAAATFWGRSVVL